MEEVAKLLRPVTEEDRASLLTVSYSKLSLFEHCAFRYKLKYVDKYYSESKTLALEIGSILHKGLELKGIRKMKDSEVDYDEIINTVYQGSIELTEKDKETLPGINDIRKRYIEEWNQKEETSGMNYTDKMDVYVHDVLPTRMEDKLWKTIGVEQNFEFVYNNRCIVHGFIDRIDQNSEGDLKVVDYKSSKKVFRDEDIKTPLQMVIYDLACVFIYGVLPKYHEYDFILLNQMQTTEDGVCTKGYLKRGIKKIDKLLDQIKLFEKTGIYKPSPTPLCYWCDYPDISHTPNANKQYAGLCPYYSLWTPDNKTFKKNREWIPGEESKRRLVF